MKKVEKMKEKKKGFYCCVCGEEEVDFQVCCGHPMMQMVKKKIKDGSLLQELTKC